MRKIAKISEELEDYTRLDKLDGQNYNVWISNNIVEQISKELNEDIQYKTVGFKGYAMNMDLEKDYECDSLSEFKYSDVAVYRAIEYLQEDVNEYLIDTGDYEDFAEIIINNIIKIS